MFDTVLQGITILGCCFFSYIPICIKLVPHLLTGLGVNTCIRSLIEYHRLTYRIVNFTYVVTIFIGLFTKEVINALLVVVEGCRNESIPIFGTKEVVVHCKVHTAVGHGTHVFPTR